MRFIAKLSFIAVIAVAVANSEEVKEEGARLAGAEATIIDDQLNRRGGDYGYDEFGSVGRYDEFDPFDEDFFSEEFGRGNCHKCGYNPCRCRRHRSYEDRSEERGRGEIVEERNEGRLRITAPHCGQNFSVCSWQSICWDGTGLRQAGYDTVLGFYVGGRACRPRYEPPELAAQARDICNGDISQKNIIFLGSSTNIDSGYMAFNIPYCLSNGFYQPVLFAFKRENRHEGKRECKIRYITAAGPWIEFIRNLGGKIESPLKRIN